MPDDTQVILCIYRCFLQCLLNIEHDSNPALHPLTTGCEARRILLFGSPVRVASAYTEAITPGAVRYKHSDKRASLVALNTYAVQEVRAGRLKSGPGLP